MPNQLSGFLISLVPFSISASVLSSMKMSEAIQAADTVSDVVSRDAEVVDFPSEDQQEVKAVPIDAPPDSKIWKIILKITAAGIEVIEPIFEGCTTSAITATYLAHIFSIPAYKMLLGVAIFRAGFDIKKNAGEIRNIIEGCLQCEVCCFTEDIFLEVVRDYETGTIKKRLEQEYLRAGIEITGLTVMIKNSEEVERTKAAIARRYLKMLIQGAKKFCANVCIHLKT